jgi:hypothetical protein
MDQLPDNSPEVVQRPLGLVEAPQAARGTSGGGYWASDDRSGTIPVALSGCVGIVILLATVDADVGFLSRSFEPPNDRVLPKLCWPIMHRLDLFD